VIDIVVTGSVVLTADVGFGASAAWNRITNTTKAFIGNGNGSTLPGTGSVIAGGSLTVDAETSETFIAVSAAGTINMNDANSPSDPLGNTGGLKLSEILGRTALAPSSKPALAGVAGVGISGDV